ncbi:MAG: hypothetical protein HY537_18605 [Deltaproteobacteria bacterium]|nr:hypothetical protein [Deltaproteobacteria bacterium]
MTRNRHASWACLWVSLIIFVLTIVIVARSTPQWTWDESWHQQTVGRLQMYGFGEQFLLNMPVATGPLYPVMQKILSPIFGYSLPTIRWMSVLFMALTLLTLVIFLRLKNHVFPPSALQLMALPVLPCMTGLAMTESTTLFFFCLNLLTLSRAMEAAERGKRTHYLFAILAGLFLGITACGRQVFLASLAALPILWLSRQKVFRLMSVLYGLSAIVLPAALFLVWGGLASPGHENARPGTFSWLCLSLAISQGALLYAIYDPSFILRDKRLSLLAVLIAPLVIVVLNRLGIIHLAQFVPLRAITSRHFPPFVDRIYQTAATGFYFGLAALFIIFWTKTFISVKDLTFRFYFTMALILLSTPGFIVHNYSSRYTMIAFPLFILIQQLYLPSETYWKAARLALAGTVGIVVFMKYASLLPY